ncbi:MAG: type II secretion system protein GspD, partial [Caulobacteraceae bacterium]|nr:type II secretion system protein GspD [Caulobacteraceae bacterium]
EGENNTRQLFVYKVQNGRSSDLAKVLAIAFGQTNGSAHPEQLGLQDVEKSSPVIGSGPPTAANGASGGPADSGSAGAQSVPSSGGNGASSENGGDQTAVATDLTVGQLSVRITSDETNNAVLVYATPRDYAVVEEALRKLDVPPYQVMIEAAITEVTLTDQLQYGLQALYHNKYTSVGLTQSTTSATPIQNFPGFSALYAGKTISAALNTLEGLTKVKVISAPKVMVLNNQTASIEVGQEVPILTGTATSVLTSSAPVVNSVDYRDTGIILRVTPRVNSSGEVLLDMAQEVSAVVAGSSTTTINSPTISTRKIATSVAIQDGEVIALGGLISDNRNDVASGLPYLSRIPVLGPLLFGNINNNDTRTELVVLLQPTVVRNVDDGRAVTDELRQKLQGLRELLPTEGVP